MKKRYVISLMILFTFIGLSLMNGWVKAMNVPTVENKKSSLKATEVTYDIPNPGSVNYSYVYNYTYLSIIRKDKTYTWKVTHLEKTSNFHIAEGDKRLKKGDRIHIKISAEVQKDLPHPENWALVYINDVRAGYSTKPENVLALWKYFLPSSVNITDPNTGNYTLHDIHTFLKNDTHWTIEGDTMKYEYTYENNGNVTKLLMTYDSAKLLMNELHLSVRLLVDGKTYSANITLIRLHGWGLPYYISTLVVWLPLGGFFILLIIALRLKLFQKIKLYFEARKLVKRE